MAISKTVNRRSRTHKETRRPFFPRLLPAENSNWRSFEFWIAESDWFCTMVKLDINGTWYISWICFFHGWKEGCFLKMVMILGQIWRNAFLRDLLFSTLSMATRGNGLRLKQKVQRRFSVVPGWSQAHLICHNVRSCCESCYPIISIKHTSSMLPDATWS